MFAKMGNKWSTGFDPATLLHLRDSYFSMVMRAWVILNYYYICNIVVVCIKAYDLAWIPTRVDTILYLLIYIYIYMVVQL